MQLSALAWIFSAAVLRAQAQATTTIPLISGGESSIALDHFGLDRRRVERRRKGWREEVGFCLFMEMVG